MPAPHASALDDPPPASSGVQQVLGGCDRHQVAPRRRAPSDGRGRGAAARPDSLHAAPRRVPQGAASSVHACAPCMHVAFEARPRA
eukprot:scaffold94781_cov61-Phaeocystis_antarctica.AAC.4